MLNPEQKKACSLEHDRDMLVIWSGVETAPREWRYEIETKITRQRETKRKAERWRF